MTSSAGDVLTKLVKNGIAVETKRIVEEEAKAASERVEIRVRGMVAEISANVCQHLEMESFTNRLVITLKIDKDAART